MAVLNQNLRLQDLQKKVRDAFSEPNPAQVLLPAGTSLFRFSGHDGISPWWGQTSQLYNLLLSAKASKQGTWDYIRNTQAVLRNWDGEMNNLIIGVLNRSVYAFAGRINAQNEANYYSNPSDRNYKQKFTKPHYFQGGNGQVYIENLKATDITIVVPPGTVNVYDNVDHIIDFLISYHLI